MTDQAARAIEVVKGYLALGMAEDALEVLDDLAPGERETVEVLRMRMKISQVLEQWISAAALAEALARHQPENPQWWLEWSISLCGAREEDYARGVLWEAAQIHPSNGAIYYQLAKCELIMGNTDLGRSHLKRAFFLDPDLKKQALKDLALIQFSEET